MLYTAPNVDPAARRDSEAVVLAVTRAAGSAFAPSADLLADFTTTGREGWRQFERRYTAEMRTLYRADPQLWIDLVEQAAFEVGDVVLVCSECGPTRPGAGEALARCHRRLLKEHAGTTGRTVSEMVADTKYGTHENYTALEHRGIRASIPPHSTTSERRAYSADRFVYELAADRFRCPAGQVLTRQGSSRTAGAACGVIYRARPKVCGACPFKAQCCPTGAARTLLRPDDGGLRDRVPAFLRTRPARRSRRRRAAWLETANAELKERHGLRRARCRGRHRAPIQALGATAAYDVKKLAQLRGSGPAARSAALARYPRHRPQFVPHRPAAGRVSRCTAQGRLDPSMTAEALTADFSNRPVGNVAA